MQSAQGSLCKPETPNSVVPKIQLNALGTGLEPLPHPAAFWEFHFQNQHQNEGFMRMHAWLGEEGWLSSFWAPPPPVDQREPLPHPTVLLHPEDKTERRLLLAPCLINLFCGQLKPVQGCSSEVRAGECGRERGDCLEPITDQREVGVEAHSQHARNEVTPHCLLRSAPPCLEEGLPGLLPAGAESACCHVRPAAPLRQPGRLLTVPGASVFIARQAYLPLDLTLTSVRATLQ